MVRPYPCSETSPWCITGLRNKNGKRARFFFKTKSDATAELDRIKIKFRDAGEKALEVTALDLGHVSPHTVFNHYREVVTPEEAERYWNIFPTVLVANMSDCPSTAVRTVCLFNRVGGRFKTSHFFSFEPVVDVLARGDLGDSLQIQR